MTPTNCHTAALFEHGRWSWVMRSLARCGCRPWSRPSKRLAIKRARPGGRTSSQRIFARRFLIIRSPQMKCFGARSMPPEVDLRLKSIRTRIRFCIAAAMALHRHCINRAFPLGTSTKPRQTRQTYTCQRVTTIRLWRQLSLSGDPKTRQGVPGKKSNRRPNNLSQSHESASKSAQIHRPCACTLVRQTERSYSSSQMCRHSSACSGLTGEFSSTALRWIN